MKIEEKKNKKPNPYFDAFVITIVTLITGVVMGFPMILSIAFGIFIMSWLGVGFFNAFLATGIILLIMFIFTFCWIYHNSIDLSKE